MWDPQQYLLYAEQRARPFHDLVARIPVERPDYVVDLGCGPGGLTAKLERRWPGAKIVGVDASAEMIQRARGCEGVEFVRADVREWAPEAAVDVMVSNAMLQWVPEHARVLRRLASFLAPGGWLAFQVPGNYEEPAHVEMRDLAASARWADRIEVAWPVVHDPVEYVDVLCDLGMAVDVWETTYVHLLDGPDDVLEWLRGSGLRPVIAQLSEAEADEFVEQYRARLHEAYPAGRHGTVLRYRRIFAVGHI
ncbi:trans-aconitate 2-methyltransferase [Phytoactinopolyspora halophila]|uniref:trans-aconitate 2-methyltransferase n=1 Tax=Phytoactinopolyspora halophila TaxID=1981511 RepID=UPI001B8CFF0B|nr:trans-aconitate 2-methyltransferase [Phytoactinopolyspora halophila]